MGGFPIVPVLSLRGAPLCGATKQSSWIATPGFAGLAMTKKQSAPLADFPIRRTAKLTKL
jgi:hypothetical protein